MVYNSIYFDDEVIPNLAGVAASYSFATHTKVDHNHVGRPVWNELWVQTLEVLAFKQLITSVKPELAYVTDHYGRAVSKRVVAPSGLLPIIKQYGTVHDDLGDWEVIGQPIHATTSLLRGIGRPQETYGGVNQAVDRLTSIGLDASMPKVWEHLRDWAKGQVNQWCYGKTLSINANGLIARVNSPVLVDGFETFFVAFQATNFPAEILRALRIGNLAEGNLRLVPIPAGGNVPVAMVNALNAERVVVFNWRRDDVEVRFAEYYNDVQNVMQPTLDEIFVMVEVTTMPNRGEMSQLIQRMDAENAFLGQKVPSDQLEMGAMMSTERSGADGRSPIMRVNAEHSPLDMVSKWFEGMKRGKKKSAQ
jgi:predicted amino acid-binding ACT domain protein